MERQSERKIKRFHSDNAKDYENSQLNTFLKQKGIIQTFTAPYSPEQNGAAERINRTLFNKVRAMLIESKFPQEFWDEALLSACFLYNRTPNASIQFKTPFKLKNKEDPNLELIKVWGSKVYKKEFHTQSKLDSKSKLYYLISFTNTNQFKLLDYENEITTIVKDIYILEN